MDRERCKGSEVYFKKKQHLDWHLRLWKNPINWLVSSGHLRITRLRILYLSAFFRVGSHSFKKGSNLFSTWPTLSIYCWNPDFREICWNSLYNKKDKFDPLSKKGWKAEDCLKEGRGDPKNARKEKIENQEHHGWKSFLRKEYFCYVMPEIHTLFFNFIKF